jgi:hypothetical protein
LFSYIYVYLVIIFIFSQQFLPLYNSFTSLVSSFSFTLDILLPSYRLYILCSHSGRAVGLPHMGPTLVPSTSSTHYVPFIYWVIHNLRRYLNIVK